MDTIDEALARVITTGKIEHLGAAASRLPAKFIADLGTFLAKEAQDPSRWMALAMTLGENRLHSSSAYAFNEALSRVYLPIEKSKVLMEWARRDEASGHTGAAVGRYFAAYRCDPRQTEALAKVKSLGRAMVPRIMIGQWDVFGALNEATDFQRYRDKVKAASNAGDMLRNAFSRNWFFSSTNNAKFWGMPLDCSFIVTKSAKPVLFVPCSVRGNNPLMCYEVPIVPFAIDDADPDDLPIAYDLAMNYLDGLGKYVGADRMDLEEPDERILTPISLFTARRVAISASVERRFVDLTAASTEIWKGVRKGHRHAIGWGKKALDIKLWDGVDDTKIAEMLMLYERSKRTAGFASADEVRDLWSGEKGDLYMVYREGAPIAAVAINYEGQNAYYTASVSIDHEEVPSSHWPLYNAILRAQEKGMRSFQFGYLETGESFGEKQRAIARFKSGFTAQFTSHIWWYVRVHTPTGDR